MGMIGYFAEIDSEKINQLLESTEKPLMDNIHDTLSGLRRLDIDKRWDFLHFGLTGTSAFDPAKNDPLSRAVLGEHSLEDGIENAEDNGCFAGLCKFPFREINRENEKADQHDVNIDKIDAGHDGDAPIVVVEDADQVTDVHHSRARAGKAQISPRGLVF